MKKFWKFNDAIDYTKKQMYDYCYTVHTEKWQGKEIKDDDKYAMIEILNHSFSCAISSDIKELVKQIKPNVQWADEHFDERVSGTPFNPPPSHERWPYAQKNNDEFGGNEKFSHTYPERIWPKYAGENFIHSATTDYQDPPNKGIRFDYGDFNDVVELLLKEPLTRQAYLPIWFPEDTGGAGGARVPCSLGYHFIMRHGYLHVNYYIRSCDFFRHFRDDVYLCARKVLWLLDELQQKNPYWDKIKPGFLTMHITSLHAFHHEKYLLNR